MKESSESSLKSRALQSVKWNALSALSSVLVQVIRTVVLARMLDPRDYGLMAMMMVAMGIADAFVDAGLGNAIIHKQTEDRKVLSSLFWTNMGLGVFVYIILAALVPVFVWYYKEPIIAQLTLVLFTSVLFRSFGRQFEALLTKELKFKQIARVEMVSNALSLIIAIVLAWAGYGVWALIWSQVGKVAIQGVTQFFLNWHEYRPHWHFQWADVKPYLGFSLFQMGEIQIRYFAQRFDQMILARFLGAITLGYYNFAYQLVQLPMMKVNPIVTRVALPVFAKIQNDNEKLRSLYIRVIHILSLLNAPLLIGIALFAPFYVPLFFGTKWIDSVPLIQVFSLVSYARSVGNPMGSLLMAKGKANIGFYLNLVLMCLNIPTIWIGVQYWGATGAILAMLLVQVALQLPIYRWIIKPLIGSCFTEYFLSWLKPFAYALISGSTGYIIATNLFVNQNLLAISIVGSVISFLVYSLILWKTEQESYQFFRKLKSGKVMDA